MTASAAAHVCMYVCGAATGALVVEEQADKPMYRRLERCAPAALSYI